MNLRTKLWAGVWLLAVCGVVGGCVAPSPPLRRIAFGSCVKQDRPQPIWKAVTAADPELFLFIGDAIYAESDDPDAMRTAHETQAAVPSYHRLRGACRLLAVWDDHDYGLDDGGADHVMRDQAQRVFLDAFDEPADSVRRTRSGLYYAETFGPPERRVQVILLDTRYFRGPLTRRDSAEFGGGPYVVGADMSVTMLGDDQWRWLAARLREPAGLRIIASGIQVVAEDHGWEKWMNLPHERTRLFDLIRESEAEGVVFISGDRHAAELSVIDAGVGYPLYDLTSSGLNCALLRAYDEPNRHRVGEKLWSDNFGLISIDWDPPVPEICFEIRGARGDVMLRHRVTLDSLRPRAD